MLFQNSLGNQIINKIHDSIPKYTLFGIVNDREIFDGKVQLQRKNHWPIWPNHPRRICRNEYTIQAILRPREGRYEKIALTRRTSLTSAVFFQPWLSPADEGGFARSCPRRAGDPLGG